MTFENYYIIGHVKAGSQELVVEAKAFLKTLPEKSRGFHDSRFWCHEDERLPNESFDDCQDRLYQEAKTKFAEAINGRADSEVVYTNLTVKQALLLAFNSTAKSGMAKEMKATLFNRAFGSMLKGMNRVCLMVYELLPEEEKKNFIRYVDSYMRESFYRHALEYDGLISIAKVEKTVKPVDQLFYEHHKKWGVRKMTGMGKVIAQLTDVVESLPKIKEIYSKTHAKSELTGVPNPGLDVVKDLINAIEDVKTASCGDIKSWLYGKESSLREWKQFPLNVPDPGLYVVAIRLNGQILYDVLEWKCGEWSMKFEDDQIVAFMALQPYKDNER